MSHVFFNVIDDQIQEKAAETIALTLSRLLSAVSRPSVGSYTAGITFVSANKESSVGLASEVLEFITRCVSSIEQSPESMQAGLSSLLLKTIAITSEPLQEVVACNVYLNIVDQVVSESVRIVNQVAYLTVLISLTQAIADSNLYQPLIRTTLMNDQVSHKLESIVRIATPSKYIAMD